MNYLNILIKCYQLLHPYRYVPNYFLSPARFFIRFLSRIIIPQYLTKKSVESSKKSDIIVSFTSFPARINNVWQVVECMLRQSYQPNKIILWLSEDQFPCEEDIPQNLLERQNDIFEIHRVPDDFKSHKKYYYTSLQYPDDLIFLIDDDIYYDTHLIERVMKAHLKYPNAIIANYASCVGYKEDGCLAPYASWQSFAYKHKISDVFFGSGGGTLFKPSMMYCDLTKIDMALKLTPTADDIWLNAMARLAKIPVVVISNNIILSIYSKDNINLSDSNIGDSKNDVQLANIINYYKNTNNINLFVS